MRNLNLATVWSCVVVLSFFVLADEGKGELAFGATPKTQELNTQVRVTADENEVQIIEYKELSNICLEIYKEHLSSMLTLITVGGAVLGYAVSSRLTRKARNCGIAVGLGLCWFGMVRHVNYTRTVRAPMEYRLYNLEHDLGIEVWRTSKPLMVYMWSPSAANRQHAGAIEPPRIAPVAKILLLVFLVVSAIGIIVLAVWTTFGGENSAFAKLEVGETGH